MPKNDQASLEERIIQRKLEREQRAARKIERKKAAELQKIETRQRDKLKIDLVCEYLLDHPTATNTELALHTGCSARTAAMARLKLRAEGTRILAHHDRVNKITEADVDEASLVAEDPDLVVENAGDLIDAINAAGGKLTDDAGADEMRRILTVILRNKALDPRVRVLAIAQKAKLDFETQDRDTLGPGVPLTWEAGVNRLIMLHEACGMKMVHEAITRTIEKKEPDDAKLSTLHELPSA